MCTIVMQHCTPGISQRYHWAFKDSETQICPETPVINYFVHR